MRLPLPSTSSLLRNLGRRRAVAVLAAGAALAMVVGMAGSGVAAIAQRATGGPVYRDAKAPVDARVRDLLRRMTLEEKVGQMTQAEQHQLKDEADIENRRIPIPGAIFRTRVKPEHFLLFGIPEAPRVLLSTDAPLIAPDDPFETVVSIERDKPLASGHAWPEAVDRMAGTPYLIAEPAGKGWAITFLDDPNFRGFWLGTAVLFGNATVLAPSFEP